MPELYSSLLAIHFSNVRELLNRATNVTTPLTGFPIHFVKRVGVHDLRSTHYAHIVFFMDKNERFFY